MDFSKVKEHLCQHGLWEKQCTILDDIEIDLPKFLGKNIEEHFENIAIEQAIDYFRLAKKMANAMPPSIPKEWLYQAGWTKYARNGEITHVGHPDANVFVFDVEVCINENDLPVIATAASEDAWFEFNVVLLLTFHFCFILFCFPYRLFRKRDILKRHDS